MPPVGFPQVSSAILDASRSKKLQLLGILCGFAAGAWLGAAEAPTKLVSIGISPMVISLIMVIGVFLARWSLPALILGTSSVRADVLRAPHLVIWALLAGCRWAVAPRRIPCMASGPHLVPESFGAPCTSPTARPT